jgi:hypothetical protein
MLQERASY